MGIRAPAGVAFLAVVLIGGGEGEVDRRLLAAAYENDVAAARRLIEDGADVDVRLAGDHDAALEPARCCVAIRTAPAQ
jgi:hypothetical protein